MISKFNSGGSDKSGTKMTAILTRRDAHVNKIVEQAICDVSLGDGVGHYCHIKVEEDGYYNVTTQICIRNNSTKPVVCDFFQMGICSRGFDDYQKCFNSQIVSRPIESQYVISDNLCSIMYLKKDTEYVAWVNFASENNRAFELCTEFTQLRLYKL